MRLAYQRIVFVVFDWVKGSTARKSTSHIDLSYCEEGKIR